MPLDFEALKTKQARRQSSGWSPKDGENLVRILPHTAKYFTESTTDFAFEFRSHFLKASGLDLEVVRCLRDRREPCPFCEAFNSLKDSQDPAIIKMIEDSGLKSGERHLMNVMNLNDTAAGIQAYECGPKVYGGLLEYVANPAWGDVLHPTTGRNFTIKLTPKGKSKSGYNDYSVQPHPQATDIAPHLPQDWQQKLDNLEHLIAKWPSVEQQAKWLKAFGIGGGPSVPPASPAPIQPPPPVIPTMPAPVQAAPPAVVPLPAPMAPPASVPQPTTAVPPQPMTMAPPAPVVAPPPTMSVPAAPVPPMGTAMPGHPVVTFAASHGLGVVSKGDGPRAVVPICFSDGKDPVTQQINQEIGYNPNKFPCEKGPCPVKADCQLRKIGLVN